MLFPVLFYLNFLHKFYCNLSTYSLLLFLLGPCFPRREQGLIYFYSVISCSFSLILSLPCTSYYHFSLISRSLSFHSSYRYFLRFYLSPVSSSSSLSISPSLLFTNKKFCFSLFHHSFLSISSSPYPSLTPFTLSPLPTHSHFFFHLYPQFSFSFINLPFQPPVIRLPFPPPLHSPLLSVSFLVPLSFHPPFTFFIC